LSKKKKCASTNATEEGPNGRHSKDLIPKSKLRPLGGEGVKEEIEKLKKPSKGRT